MHEVPRDCAFGAWHASREKTHRRVMIRAHGTRYLTTVRLLSPDTRKGQEGLMAPLPLRVCYVCYVCGDYCAGIGETIASSAVSPSA